MWPDRALMLCLHFHALSALGFVTCRVHTRGPSVLRAVAQPELLRAALHYQAVYHQKSRSDRQHKVWKSHGPPDVWPGDQDVLGNLCKRQAKI